MPSLVTRHPSPATHNEPATASLWDSFHIQLRVIGALLMREVITRFGRHNIGFLWLFLEPVVFTLGIVALWSIALGGHGKGLPMLGFALTGYSSILVYRGMASRLMLAVGPNTALLYHQQVRLMDIYISRLLLEIGAVTMSFFTLAIIFTLLELLPAPVNPLQVVLGWILLIWFSCGLAFCVGTLSEKSDLVEKVWMPITYLFFPLSGAGYLVDWLPRQYQELALYIPTVSAIEYIREGYFGDVMVFHYDLLYLFLVSSILMLIGLSQVQVTARNVVHD